jgi:hypothetical protein
MDIDKIKTAFISHFEKIVLGGVVAASGFLVYQGAQLPDFTKEKQPEQLAQEANTVKLAIDDDHTEEIIKERKPLPGDSIVARTKELYKPVDPTTYKLSKVWVGEASADSVIRRQDPLLLPPIDLRTMGVICSIAANGARTVDGYPLAELEGADDLEPEEKRPRTRGRRGRRGMDDMDMDMGMGMMPGDEMMEMMGGMRGRRSKDEDAKPISRRKFDPTQNLGYTPSEMGGQQLNKNNYPQPKIGWFIAGTALLPHREIYEAYELALKDAGGYDPSRDTPLYYDFEVQRADVTQKSVEDLTEDDWSKVYDRSLYTKIADTVWSGFAAEIVPEDYRDENITTWIPPVLLDDYAYFALHPKIPLLSKREIEEQTLMEELKNDTSDMIDLENLDLQNNQSELADPGATGAMGGMGGGYDDMMMDSGFDEMYSGGGMGLFSRGQVEVDPVDHKLIRFYDFGLYPSKAKPGHKYSYRLRYAVIDPNFPAIAQFQPATSKLSPDVAQRVTAKIADARATGKRDFRLWSEWSEPTLPDSLPTTYEAFTGSVNAGSVKSYQVAGRTVPVARESPTAKVLLSQFDFKLGVRVPVIVEEIREGGVLSKTAEVAEVIDPITNEIKKVTDYELKSSLSVVDLDGGVPLEMSEDLTSPGQMLLFDSTGKLSVSNDIDDQRSFRVYSFAKEKEAIKK